ncbi:MAG: glycosyltransferase [Candidatus Moranbacteria bacterium]|nr:glycosyltransferase [Candidatus Moranbacteria bacterium]
MVGTEEYSISVIVPCYNEGKNIQKTIRTIESYLKEHFQIFEIIAVNDGSIDDTEAKLRALEEIGSLKIVSFASNRGKGFAVRQGVLSSRYEVVMFLDADLGIPIQELGKFLQEIKKGTDLVIASRFVPGLLVAEPVLWYRRLMEKIFRLLRMVVLGVYHVQDTQCGFKVFRRQLIESIFPLMQIERFAFDAELIFLAYKKGYSIKELPITLQNPANSSIRIVRDSLNMLGDLIKIRIYAGLGKYKKR